MILTFFCTVFNLKAETVGSMQELVWCWRRRFLKSKTWK